MKVLLLSAEVYPFAKTGGLGDVAGALPRALQRLGVEVGVVMPWYRKIAKTKPQVEVVAESVPCRFAGADRPFRLLRGRLPGPERIPVWFVQNEGVFEEDDDDLRNVARAPTATATSASSTGPRPRSAFQRRPDSSRTSST